MSIRHDRPVPTSIRHRGTWRAEPWRGPRRICVCGLRWPCQDRPRVARTRWSTDAATLRRLLDGLRGDGS